MIVNVKPPVTETKVVEIEPGEVTLTITFEDARMLHALMGACLSRDYDGTPFFNSLHSALSEHKDVLGESWKSYDIRDMDGKTIRPFKAIKRFLND